MVRKASLGLLEKGGEDSFFGTRRIHVTGIFTYIFRLVFMVNVGKYTIHGCYGVKVLFVST